MSAVLVCAQTEERKIPVKFPSGEKTVALKGSIKGYESVRYLLGSAAGQRWKITLQAGGSTYFNIVAPGESSALFIGETEGRAFENKLPKAGEYGVIVYQMRSSARRGTKSNYTITFEPLAGSAPAAGGAAKSGAGRP